MERFFKDPNTVLRMRKGALGTYLDQLADQLNKEGYARYSSRLQLRLIAQFGRWLKQESIAVQDVTLEHTEQYLEYRGSASVSEPATPLP